MQLLPITENDIELINAARETMKKFFSPGKHHVAAALRTRRGGMYTAVHLEGHAVAICAETAALAKAVSEGETDFDTIVAVRHPRSNEHNQEIQIVSPCGTCRELLSDYAENLNVILSDNGNAIKTSIRELLPHKYNH